MTQFERSRDDAAPVYAREKYADWDYVIRADDLGWTDDGKTLPYYETSMVRPSDAWGIDGWVPVMIPRHLSGSDYSGDVVTASNYRVFMAQYGNVPGVYSFSSGYGGYGVLLTPWALAWVIEGDPVEDYGVDTRPVGEYGPEYWRSRIKTLRDVLADLENYCVLDEEDWSELEREREDEAWGSYYARDFRTALARVAGYEFVDDWDEKDEKLWQLCREAMDAENVYWVHETGSSVYLDVERIAGAVTLAMFTGVDVDPARENARWVAEQALTGGSY